MESSKDTAQISLDLGFADECEPKLLVNSFFPSKIGGKPAWLDLENIPTLDDLKCDECSMNLSFLLQVYATIDEKPECFHRTIYVFICQNESCQTNSKNVIKVFRCQLPRQNNFFDFNPPDDDADIKAVLPEVTLCRVCGYRGPYSCSKCKKVSYCTADHQKHDWKQRHKIECNSKILPLNENLSTLLIKEFEIGLEPENQEVLVTDSDLADSSDKPENEYAKCAAANENATLKNISENELMSYCNQSIEDGVFGKFKKEISQKPHQILRYSRGGTPLWITKTNIAKPENIENCEHCGGQRIFEFQIMPQLLNQLENSKLDWGIIAVYTCENSCDTGSTYLREFAYKQDVQ